MIDWFQALTLALVQGLTEFLPISSSAHLVIPALVLDWPDQGLAFDVAVHVGTLAAVMLYFRRELQVMTGAWLGSLTGRAATADSRLVWYLLLASVPAAVAGVAFEDYIESHARSLPVIASTTLVFGLLLGIADRYADRTPGSRSVSLGVALFVGIAQALALVPGVSRSGVTITAGLMLNLSRQQAARFSFLLSIPVIAGAGTLQGWELAHSGVSVQWTYLAVAALTAAAAAFSCIAAFLRLLDRLGMLPFVYYRIVLAIVLYAIWMN